MVFFIKLPRFLFGEKALVHIVGLHVICPGDIPGFFKMLAVSGEGIVARKVAVLVHEHGVDIEIPAFFVCAELLERGVEGVDAVHALHLVGIGVHFLRDG